MSYAKFMGILGLLPLLASTPREPWLDQELPPLPAKPKRFHKVAKSKRRERKKRGDT